MNHYKKKWGLQFFLSGFFEFSFFLDNVLNLSEPVIPMNQSSLLPVKEISANLAILDYYENC